MIKLGLIANKDSEHWYRCSSYGSKLGDAFEKNITVEIGDKFIDCVIKGYADTKYLNNEFKAFALHQIPDGEEMSLYHNIILGQDAEFVSNPTCFRASTINLLLKDVEESSKSKEYRTFNNIVVSFLQSNFEDVLDNDLEASDEKKLWFLYELNELVHYSFEVFHAGLLRYLTEKPQPFDFVIDKILDEVENACCEKEVETVSDLDCKKSIHEIFAEMRDEKLVAQQFCLAIQLLYVLNKSVNSYLDDFKEQKIGSEPIKREGYAPALLPYLIEGKENMKIVDIVREIIIRAINIHTRSSFEKSTITKGIVNNYLIDDGFIWKLKDTIATRTSPRIKNTIQYLIDMKLVSVTSEGFQLTPNGLTILKS